MNAMYKCANVLSELPNYEIVKIGTKNYTFKSRRKARQISDSDLFWK